MHINGTNSRGDGGCPNDDQHNCPRAEVLTPFVDDLVASASGWHLPRNEGSASA